MKRPAPASAAPAGGWKGLLPYAPVGLLCLVVAAQVYLTRTSDLTPWKGGGFGMFSTNDSRRQVRVWVLGRDGVSEYRQTDEIPETRRAGEFPSHRRLRSLARKVAGIVRSTGQEVREVRVEVWSTNYNATTMAPDPELLRQTSVRFDSPR